MEITPLCEIAYKYRTDKCPQIKHAYTPFYYKMFNHNRFNYKKVLELGIGTMDSMKHCPDYKVGASLFMWSEFFPFAQIYGADISPECMIKYDDIETFLCDETKKEDLENLIKQTGPDIDLFIDDGSHDKNHQIFTAKTLMPLLKKDVVYIIEDVAFPDTIRKALSEYEVIEPDLPGRKYPKGRLLIVKNK